MKEVGKTSLKAVSLLKEVAEVAKLNNFSCVLCVFNFFAYLKAQRHLVKLSPILILFRLI